MPDPISFRSYYTAVAKEAREEATWGRDNLVIVFLLLALAALVGYFFFQQDPDWKGITVTCWVFGPLLFLYAVATFWRAAWKVHQKQDSSIQELDAFKKCVEAKEVHLEPSNPLCSTFVTNFNWESGSSPGLCLRSGFTNNRKPGFPGKTAHRVKANITYFDGEREPFTIEGRWVRTNQPAAYSPLQDKTEILRVDFEPGTCHELDIANKMPFEPGCYAVAWNDLRARMLVGPIVKVKIELIAEYVCQVFECVFETSEGKLEALG
jgi:hypothetical protein